MPSDGEPYLRPYLRAVKRHGAGFESLLWASPQTQAARFDAIVRACNLTGLSLLDAGCGRGDLLGFLLGRGIEPAHYLGIEAVPELVKAARRKGHARCMIVEADFVLEPKRLFAGADAIIFCGSLNTLDAAAFYRSLRAAVEAAGKTVVFNFLCSPRLASAEWLTWHRVEDVLAFARQMAEDVTLLDDYMEGDCTIALRKQGAPKGP
jgi:SAM-dependent methyltransferase